MSSESDTGKFLRDALLYFMAYIVFGIGTKWLMKVYGMSGMEVLYQTTIGGMLICLFVVAIRRWPRRFQSEESPVKWSGITMPREYPWIIGSGICTAFVIPTTTVMYTFGFSIMVAMIIMRGALIIAGRAVDAILIGQGHSVKKVYWQEELAWIVATAGVVVVVFWAESKDLQFKDIGPAATTMALYIVPYSIRIYIMNRFNATGMKRDTKAFFGIEQAVAATTIIIVSAILLNATYMGWEEKRMLDVQHGFENPDLVPILIGTAYGFGAFFSVFLFMRKGRNATFNTTVNRLTSLLAGTAATLLFWLFFAGKEVKDNEWVAFCIMLFAIGLLGWADYRREKEKPSIKLPI